MKYIRRLVNFSWAPSRKLAPASIFVFVGIATSTPASEDEAGDGDGEETNEEVLQRHRDHPLVQALFRLQSSRATLRALMDVDATAIDDDDGSGGSGSGVDGDESDSSCASGMSRAY